MDILNRIILILILSFVLACNLYSQDERPMEAYLSFHGVHAQNYYIFTPADGKDYPAMVLFFGGGWKTGDR